MFLEFQSLRNDQYIFYPTQEDQDSQSRLPKLQRLFDNFCGQFLLVVDSIEIEPLEGAQTFAGGLVRLIVFAE